MSRVKITPVFPTLLLFRYLHDAIIRLINDSNSGFNDLSSSSSIPKSKSRYLLNLLDNVDIVLSTVKLNVTAINIFFTPYKDGSVMIQPSDNGLRLQPREKLIDKRFSNQIKVWFPVEKSESSFFPLLKKIEIDIIDESTWIRSSNYNLKNHVIVKKQTVEYFINMVKMFCGRMDYNIFIDVTRTQNLIVLQLIAEFHKN
ncbi:hypothetical protein AGLY_000766 [Aphis glycines]|uniref:Uncharacterized protein n=1 Tax=Aphis glycines TaxID=307491 RepID=A0A6G0U8E9_APHGL|nr:hypothetical protein AGLY_000766 [Aphis glycines]